MPIRIVDRYTRQEIRNNPDSLYVFGDNIYEQGRGGQAKECRGEPNAVGIPTKLRPTMEESAFFTDKDFEIVKPHIQKAFRKLAAHIAGGGEVVWPKDGVGTGLAQLDKRAPSIAAFIERCRIELDRRCAS